jgi:hypothetical protein
MPSYFFSANRSAFSLSRSISSASSSTPFGSIFLASSEQLFAFLLFALDDLVQTLFGDVVCAFSLVFHIYSSAIGRSIWLNRATTAQSPLSASCRARCFLQANGALISEEPYLRRGDSGRGGAERDLGFG